MKKRWTEGEGCFVTRDSHQVEEVAGGQKEVMSP